MADLDLERTLTIEWEAFVAAVQPDPRLAASIATGGVRISRSLIWADLEDVRLAMAELHSAAGSEHARRLATSRWTVKDVVAHLASWAAEFRRQVETVASKKPFDYLITFTPKIGPTAWNAREVDRRRELPLEACVEEFSEETARLQGLALALPDAVLFGEAELPQTADGRPESRWRTQLGDLMLMKCRHDRYHLDRLREVLEVTAD